VVEKTSWGRGQNDIILTDDVHNGAIPNADCGVAMKLEGFDPLDNGYTFDEFWDVRFVLLLLFHLCIKLDLEVLQGRPCHATGTYHSPDLLVVAYCIYSDDQVLLGLDRDHNQVLVSYLAISVLLSGWLLKIQGNSLEVVLGELVKVCHRINTFFLHRSHCTCR